MKFQEWEPSNLGFDEQVHIYSIHEPQQIHAYLCDFMDLDLSFYPYRKVSL